MKTVYYFTADWCQPCKKMRPLIQELKRDQAEGLFQTIDVDDNDDLVKRFQVKSVPTFILFEEGIEKSRLVGAQTREQLEGLIYG